VLYGYPIEATADNWMHDAICQMVRAAHANVASGVVASVWPEVVPEEYRPRLASRTGLRARLSAYLAALAALSPTERDRVLRALEDENDIARLLKREAECASITELPLAIREPAISLFSFAFDLLTDFDVRDSYYRVIEQARPGDMCPFCGCEYLDAPGGPREPFDHYLSKSRYPFAAANLRNLVPMCAKCNSQYKKATDILRREDGTRRRAFDPYDVAGVTVSLDGSVPFSVPGRSWITWRVDIAPESEEVDTWDAVFSIRDRYKRNVLERSYSTWLDRFGAWVRGHNPDPSDEDIVAETAQFARFHDASGLKDRAFLQAAFFRMLHKHCASGDSRLVAFLRMVIVRC